MSLRGLSHALAPRREAEAVPRHGSDQTEIEHDKPGVASLWEIRLAARVRALIRAKGAFHLLESAVLYRLLCFGALAIHALRMTCRIRTGFVLNLTAIFLLTLGAGALWEITEFGVDVALGAGAQGSRVMAPLDYTMWNLILDGLGGLFGAL